MEAGSLTCRHPVPDAHALPWRREARGKPNRSSTSTPSQIATPRSWIRSFAIGKPPAVDPTNPWTSVSRRSDCSRSSIESICGVIPATGRPALRIRAIPRASAARPGLCSVWFPDSNAQSEHSHNPVFALQMPAPRTQIHCPIPIRPMMSTASAANSPSRSSWNIACRRTPVTRYANGDWNGSI